MNQHGRASAVRAFIGCLLLSAVMVGCDKGIVPPTIIEEGGNPGTMSGTVRFQNWPPSDSLLGLRVVAFRNFPPSNIINEVLSGGAVVYPPLGGPELSFNVDSLEYTFQLPSATYPYVVIAHRFGPITTVDWRVVGQYDLDSNLTVPSPVTIVAGTETRNIDIFVDFDNPPPPPF